MDVIFWLIDRIVEVAGVLRGCSFAGTNLLVISFGGVFLSMVIAIFWKGAKG